MFAITERIVEDGGWFLILIGVLSFFWFHHRRTSARMSFKNEKSNRAEESNSSRAEKVA